MEGSGLVPQESQVGMVSGAVAALTSDVGAIRVELLMILISD